MPPPLAVQVTTANPNPKPNQVTTHAVLNAVRRLVMILFTSYFFGEPRTLNPNPNPNPNPKFPNPNP